MPDIPETINRYILAYNTLNVEGMLKCLSDDVEFQNISNGEINTHTNSKKEFEDLAKMGV